MINRSNAIAGSAPDIAEAADSGLAPQLGMMLRALLSTAVLRTLVLLAVALLVVVVATAFGQIRLNEWNKPFYDALSHRDFAEFLVQLGIFGLIAGALLVLNVAQRWLVEMLKLKLREGLVHDLVENWLLAGRALRLAQTGSIGVNPDQRLHEDARHLTELSADLGVGLLQASILLVAFLAVLFSLSGDFALHIAGRRLAIPGYMVWAAILYAGSASILSYWIGRGLISRNAEHYAREAELRSSLIRVNEHIDAISLAGGEADEARRIERDLAAVLGAVRRLVTGLTNLTWITAGFGWVTLVAPILIAAPLYFADNLSFGGLMMAAGAFTQAQSSLRWFIDNFSSIADWRATLLRVASFRRAVISDELRRATSRIAFVEGEPGRIVMDHLEIASPSGCIMLDESTVQVRAGERLLIEGAPGADKTLLLRTLAGLWPWGSGRVERPKGEAIFYMPHTPYLPPGTLREILAYPLPVETFSHSALTRALERLGLERLLPMLELSQRWDRELSDDEQQRLAFARVALQVPPWIIMDELLASLDDDALERVLDVLAKDLDRSGIIHIGRAQTHDPIFSRTVHLINDPQSTCRRESAIHAAPAR